MLGGSGSSELWNVDRLYFCSAVSLKAPKGGQTPNTSTNTQSWEQYIHISFCFSTLFISFSSRSPFMSHHEWALCQWLQAFLYWTISCVRPRRYTLALKYTLNQNLLRARNVFNSYISVWLGWNWPLLLYVDFIYVHLIFHRVTLTLSQKYNTLPNMTSCSSENTWGRWCDLERPRVMVI